MARKPRKLDIRKLEKPGKLIVTELDDEVEIILDGTTIADIEGKKRITTAVRVIDRVRIPVTVRRLVWALLKAGVIDYIENASGDE